MATEPATDVHGSFVEKRHNLEAAGKHRLAASRQLKTDEPSKHEQTQRNLRPCHPVREAGVNLHTGWPHLREKAQP